MIYSVISFDFTDHALKEDFKDLLRDCGALHEKNEYTYALEEGIRFDHMVKAIGEWKEQNEFDYTDYVRIYRPGTNEIVAEDLV